jgi:hypothetical protein
MILYIYIDAPRCGDIVTQPDDLDRDLDELIMILLLSLCFNAFFLVSGALMG